MDIEKHHDEILEKLKQARLRKLLDRRTLDSSTYTARDLGYKATVERYQPRDHDGNAFQKGLDRIEHSVKHDARDEKNTSFIERMLAND